RRGGMLDIPAPGGVGSFEQLWKIANVSVADRPLVLGWLVAALRPRGPYPILMLNGEQGSAKTTTAKALRALIDPNVASARRLPKDERDLAIAAGNAWILSFDNISGLPGWLSDSLCALATGSGFATRQNYSDTDEVIFGGARPIVLNGIPDLGS